MPEATPAEYTAALATMELRLVREMNAVEERTRTRIEALRVEIASNPATFAGLRASVAEIKDTMDDELKPKIESLQLSDRRWGGAAMVISAIIAGVGSWLFGEAK